jgi:hypothetical protein
MESTNSADMRVLLKALALNALVFIALFGIHVPSLRAQVSPAQEHSGAYLESCEKTLEALPMKEVLRPVCPQGHAADEGLPVRNAIIIGFVGGFVKHDDLKHPEVNFAALLDERYPSNVHAEVFANRDGEKALLRVLQLLDVDDDGVINASEKEDTSVIIYGHSWGGSQTVELARALGRHGVPVSLTIQVDSVRKPGQQDSTIPSNVKKAINFYQTRGPIHGRSTIRAANPEKTNILGNIEMTYQNRRINCDNYPWFPRHFNKPHHEIENDPDVWSRVASLIDSELSTSTETAEASMH